jgi:hypothetical protein
LILINTLYISTNYLSILRLDIVQAYEVLKLVNQLIPSAAKDLAAMQFILAKEKILSDQPSLLCQFSKDILPVFIKVCSDITELLWHPIYRGLTSVIFWFS